MAIVSQELNKYPADERLLWLQSNLKTQLSHWTVEKARAGYLSRAREALDKREFSEAVRLLQNCQAEGIFSEQIKSLLDVARHELELQQQTEKKQKLLHEARGLMSQGNYQAVIEMLLQFRPEEDDPALRTLLEKASSLKQAQSARVDAALERIRQLADQAQYEEALAFAEAQPSSVTQSPGLEKTLAALREAAKRDDSATQSISLAYAALQSLDLKTALTEMHSAYAGCGSPFLSQVVKIFEQRCRSAADQQIGKAIRQSLGVLRQDPKRATEIMGTVAPLVVYASSGMKANWQSARRKIRFAGMLRRLRI
jgi:AraC-like DNA-binding protein